MKLQLITTVSCLFLASTTIAIPLATSHGERTLDKRCESVKCIASLGPTVLSCASAAAQGFANIIVTGGCAASAMNTVVNPPDTCTECVSEFVDTVKYDLNLSDFDPKDLVGDAFEHLKSIVPDDVKTDLKNIHQAIHGQGDLGDAIKDLLTDQKDDLKDKVDDVKDKIDDAKDKLKEKWHDIFGREGRRSIY